MIPLDSFVGQSADGKMVPIIPGGNSIPLTFTNRKEYVERAIEYRLHEIDRQVRLYHIIALKLHKMCHHPDTYCMIQTGHHCLHITR